MVVSVRKRFFHPDLRKSFRNKKTTTTTTKIVTIYTKNSIIIVVVVFVVLAVVVVVVHYYRLNAHEKKNAHETSYNLHSTTSPLSGTNTLKNTMEYEYIALKFSFVDQFSLFSSPRMYRSFHF